MPDVHYIDPEYTAHAPDDAYAEPGKFEGERWLAVHMYESAMESGADEEGGDSTDGPGYYWLFIGFEAADKSIRHGILCENSQGFVSLTEYDTIEEARDAWRVNVEPALEEFYEARNEDAVDALDDDEDGAEARD